MDFTDGEREFMAAMRAITIDPQGFEIYVGLGPQDSLDFLALSRRHEAGTLDAGDEGRFQDLHRAHETARQEIAEGRKSLHPGERL